MSRGINTWYCQPCKAPRSKYAAICTLCGAARPAGDRPDITVPASAEVRRARTRLEQDYRAESDPERAAVLSTAILHADALLSAILSINLYDERTERRRRDEAARATLGGWVDRANGKEDQQ